MPIRLIVTDIDGTLIDSPRCTSISPRNMAALRRAQEQGVTLAIASGRNHAYCQLLAEEIGFSGILISNAGSEVRDSSTVYSRHLMDPDLIPFAMRFSAARNLQPVVFSSFGLYIMDQGSPQANEAACEMRRQVDRAPYVIALSDEAAMNHLKEHGYMKIVFMAESDAHARAALADWNRAIDAGILPPMDVFCSFPSSFEINRDDVSKGAGVRDLAKALNLTEDEIMCLGDNGNDVTMFEVCTHSVAMGNAPDSVKARARYVTGHVADDGLAQAIEKYVLGL